MKEFMKDLINESNVGCYIFLILLFMGVITLGALKHI